MFWIQLGLLLALMNPAGGDCLSGNCLNGYGKYVFHDGGTSYEGQFVNGRFNGIGILIRPDGATYKGQFSDNKFNGSGILILNGGARYVGGFKDGFYHGEGNLTLPDGTKARRETNTMPQWAGSCWYYLRFLDPRNDRALVDAADRAGIPG